MISLALKSLRQRVGLSLVCIFACAIAVASLGASLGVGDALESELARLARARRGQATDVLLFSRPLSAAVLARAAELPGRAAAVYDERGRTRVPEGPHIESTVLGIDDSYTALHGLPFPAPKGREAYLSAELLAYLFCLTASSGSRICTSTPPSGRFVAWIEPLWSATAR